jgi:hypothetical protein
MHAGNIEGSGVKDQRAPSTSTTAPPGAPKPRGVQDACSEHSGWFPRGAWEAALQRISRTVCELLPTAATSASTAAPEAGLQRVSGQGGLQVASQEPVRMGSLPTQALPPPDTRMRTSRCEHDGPREELTQSSEGLRNQGAAAYHLQPSAPAANAAGLSADDLLGTDRELENTPWREAFEQISKTLQV